MKATHKKLIQKGGIHCPCCRLGRNCLKETRVKLNRVTRRQQKQTMQGEIEEELNETLTIRIGSYNVIDEKEQANIELDKLMEDFYEMEIERARRMDGELWDEMEREESRMTLEEMYRQDWEDDYRRGWPY